MDFRSFLQENIVCLDGGMGTLLQARGLRPGERPETWCLTHPAEVEECHRAYYDAGSNVVSTNTFGASLLHFSREELGRIVPAAVELVRSAAAHSTGTQPKFVALDMGPSGKLLRPLGDLDFEDAVAVFAETVRLGAAAGADLIFIETMNDSYETKAALLAAKENADLPVMVSNAYGADGKLMTGANPAAMVALLEGLGAEAVGLNCSLGPEALAPLAEEYVRLASVPVLFKPNAGLPEMRNGRTVFNVAAGPFADTVTKLVKKGVRIAGGCCGTTPEYIAALHKRLQGLAPRPVTKKDRFVVSSGTHAVTFGDDLVVIGERLNPTGKKRVKEALRSGDQAFLLEEAVMQQEQGAAILDVNVGLPEIDEKTVLRETVRAVQTVTDLPVQIDTSSAAAMENALRICNGKALLNSVNGKAESMAAIFPLMKKYGGMAVALTLDDSGIPETAEERVAIAERILNEAAGYGLGKKDFLFDSLAMAVSAAPHAGRTTLETIRRLTAMGCRTVLGVSNISFGLPDRPVLNNTFLALARELGLSAAIVNPAVARCEKDPLAEDALLGRDPGFAAYLAAAESRAAAPAAAGTAETAPPLQRAIRRGLRADAETAARELLLTAAPLEIVEREILPALDKVGDDFQKQRIFLPQLLMSAEAAGSAFEVIRAAMPAGEGSGEKGGVILATVRGDVHDIGKNIVKLLLENYGFAVTDLGRDVPPETILAAVRERGISLVGLSALMTTTVPAMEETIALLRAEAPETKVVVGGAVLTEEYAAAIGADCYGKDAMDTVRFAAAYYEEENQ